MSGSFQKIPRWKKREIKSLINLVKTLNIGNPVDTDDEEWHNIDIFLKKPAGSSLRKFMALMIKFEQEATNSFSLWEYFDQLKEVLPVPSFTLVSNQNSESVFNMTSISDRTPTIFNRDDPDLTFLMQLLPDLQNFNEESKSFFKVEIQALIHRLKYGSSAAQAKGQASK